MPHVVGPCRRSPPRISYGPQPIERGGPRLSHRRLAGLVATGVAVASAVLAPTAFGARQQTTDLISRSFTGGVPNGPSTNAVISRDKRYARVIAFQSDASNIVRGDVDGVTDVFAIRRAGPVGNNGAPWHAGSTVLVSRTFNGAPANGPSFSPAVDGGFNHAPSCVAFLSAASNLVPGDTNGVVDAFVSHGPGGAPQRVSLLPRNAQSTLPVTQVAVSGDCSRIAFVAGGRLYVRARGKTVAIAAPGAAADPSFSTGLRNDLVFAAAPGVYLSRDGTGRPRLVAPGGSQPGYNDIKRQTVTYVKSDGGHLQVFSRDLGRPEQLVSGDAGRPGNGDATAPVIGNSGYYIAFQTTASNLSATAAGSRTDQNLQPDVYLYTGVRKITIAESVMTKGDPIGGSHPSMSFYANYILFDSAVGGSEQVMMRYLGSV